MGKPNLQPIRGFRDLYPQDMALRYYIFGTLKRVADLMGFEPYDGPLLEPIELYINKTSEELVKKQSYIIRDKNDQELLLRPEMTPSLARMVAARANQLIFPLRLFNLGLRYRYEAPQKGRSREFMQADFDILGTKSVLADAEVINAAVSILLSFGFKGKDFVVRINSRKFMEGKLLDMGIAETDISSILTKIDRTDKSDQSLPDQVVKLLASSVRPEDNKYFDVLFGILKSYGIDRYCKIDLSVVRGLDYYTGLVFEVKKTEDAGRNTIIGGGRYDNLVTDLYPKLNIPGVGFSVSDIVLSQLLKDNDLVPTLKTKQTKVLVTVFKEETVVDSLTILQKLREAKIPSEIYLGIEVKLEKQLKYADNTGIPYAVIVGPEEIKKNVVKLKNMKTREQRELSQKQLVMYLKSQSPNSKSTSQM